MKISKTIIALMILISSASAQTFFQQGTVELGGDISLSSQTQTLPDYLYDNYGNIIAGTSSSNLTTFSFNPYFGVMVADGFELGIRPGITISNPGSSTILNAYFAPAYNFDTKSNIYPYVELLAGYNSDKEDDVLSSGFGIGGDVGFKLAIKGSSLFLFKLEYVSQSFTINNANPYNYNYNYNYGYYQYPPQSIKYTIGTLSFGVGFRVFISPKAKTAKS